MWRTLRSHDNPRLRVSLRKMSDGPRVIEMNVRYDYPIQVFGPRLFETLDRVLQRRSRSRLNQRGAGAGQVVHGGDSLEAMHVRVYGDDAIVVVNHGGDDNLAST